MSWNTFTYSMGNLTNLTTFAQQVKDKSNGNFFTRLQDAGLNLWGNSMAIRTARDTRTYTGSNVGYMGFFQANGNASDALYNTSNASLWAYNMLTPRFYDNMNSTYGMGSGGMYGMGGMSMAGGLQGSSIFNNRYHGYWA